MNANISTINTLTKQELLDIISKSSSISDLLRTLGKNPQGAARRTFYKRCKRDNIDIKTMLKYVKSGYRRYTDTEVFITGSKIDRASLKARIIKDKIIEYKCLECGLGPAWMGENLILILDHINGIYNDNRVENLRFLCPNCNSQMETFAGRNSKR